MKNIKLLLLCLPFLHAPNGHISKGVAWQAPVTDPVVQMNIAIQDLIPCLQKCIVFYKQVSSGQITDKAVLESMNFDLHTKEAFHYYVTIVRIETDRYLGRSQKNISWIDPELYKLSCMLFEFEHHHLRIKNLLDALIDFRPNMDTIRQCAFACI